MMGTMMCPPQKACFGCLYWEVVVLTAEPCTGPHLHPLPWPPQVPGEREVALRLLRVVPRQVVLRACAVQAVEQISTAVRFKCTEQLQVEHGACCDGWR